MLFVFFSKEYTSLGDYMKDVNVLIFGDSIAYEVTEQ